MIKGPIPKMNHGKSISSPYKDKPVLKTKKFKTEFTKLSQMADTFSTRTIGIFNWGDFGDNTLSVL